MNFKIPSYSITNESKCFLRLLEISAFTPWFTPPVTDVNAGECGISLLKVLGEWKFLLSCNCVILELLSYFNDERVIFWSLNMLLDRKGLRRSANMFAFRSVLKGGFPFPVADTDKLVWYDSLLCLFLRSLPINCYVA